MKTSCATSSRSVIVFIQRRTAGDALRRAGLGLGGVGALRGVAGEPANANSSKPMGRRDEMDATLPVCQIQRPPARAEGGGFPCDPGGLRGAGRLTRRFTPRTRWAASLALLERTMSAEVLSSVRPNGSTKPESRITRALELS